MPVSGGEFDAAEAAAFARGWMPCFGAGGWDEQGLFEGTRGISFGEECAALDFEMDCGHAFERAYLDCFNDPVALRQAIGGIDDPMLIGSALYSQWRYWNHWTDDPFDDRGREWFVTALGRLLELAGDEGSRDADQQPRAREL